MSRLGDLIRTERLRSKMTPKQVARKCGVSESYLLAVEAGTKIIADDQARRILKTIGLREQTEADFSLDDIAATVDLASASPAVAKAVERPKSQPEYELVATTKTTGKKQDDDTDKDENVTGSVWLDALTSVLKRVPIMLVEYNSHRFLRKIKKLNDYSVLLQSYDREYEAVEAQISECSFLGRASKLEITL